VTATAARHRHAPRPAARPPAAIRGRGGRPGRSRALATPAALRLLLAALVLLSLAWGEFGGWVAAQHSSAARALVAVDEPLSLDAQQMYQSIADADATITAALLTSSQPDLAPLQRYARDIATAAADLSRLRAGDSGPGADASLTALIGGLADYADYVAKARTEYATGYPLTGGSFVQVASEEAHLVLLPAAKAVFAREDAARGAASSQATGLPLVVTALVLALITGYVLLRAQRWLARRTNRVLSPGLVLASLLLVVSVIWLAAGFLSARSDLDSGIDQGAAPAQELALAAIGVQQIRGDAVLNVISRSGNASFADDFKTASRQIGPGPGSWLTLAAAQQAGGRGAALVGAAIHDAPAWYTANQGVYTLGSKASYAAEQDLVVGSGPGSTAAGYSTLENELSDAIQADQAVFATGATAGRHVLDPLAWVVIVASLLMAAGCGWAVSRRLAEYR
jgi:hypothetical protein